MTDEPSRHPITGRFLAFDCEIDCQTACAGLCGEHGGPADDCEQCRDERETADDRATDDFYANAPEHQWCEDDKADSYEEDK